MKRRYMHMICNILCGYVFRYVLFHELDCTLYRMYPFHLYHFLR